MMEESGYVDDAFEEKVARIGQDVAAEALERNFERMFETIIVTVPEELTVDQARKLAHRLTNHPRVTRIELRSRYDDGHLELGGNILKPLLEVAIQRYSEVQLLFHMNDDVAETLGALLLRLAGNGVKHAPLQKLELCIRHNITMDSAQQLAIGLRQAKLRCLELNFELVNDENPLNNVKSMIYQSALESVERLVLGCYFGDETARVIGNALIGNTTLQSFSFELVDDLSIDAVMTLANGISRSHIIHLNMNANLSEAMEDTLYEWVAKLPTIRYLTIYEGFVGTPGLAQCLSQLHTLELFTSLVEDLPALMIGLRNAPRLSTLELGHNFYTSNDIMCFCAALPYLTSLTELTMSFDLPFVFQYPDEESLDHQTQCIQATMVAVANHPSLVRLHLNSCYAYAGLAMIGMQLPNIKLKELHLDFIDDDYHHPSDDRNKLMACQALIAGVQSNWHLHVLMLTGARFRGRFPSKVQDEVNFYLDLNKSGQHLLYDCDYEQHPTGIWCHVLAKCGNKADFVYYHLREQPTLLMTAGMCQNKLDGKVNALGVSVPVGTKRRREE